MSRTMSPELSPQLAEEQQIINDFNQYFIGMKDRLGDLSQHTREQLHDVSNFRERNPYFSTAGYSLEAEPDVYDVSDEVEAAHVQHADKPSHIDTPLVSEPIVPNNILDIGVIKNNDHELISRSPSHALLFKDGTYVVVLPPKESGVIDAAPAPEEDNHTFVSDNEVEDNVELSPDALLAVARYKVAELSIQLRGKSSKKLNTELRGKFQEALAEYKRAYDVVNKEGEATLKGEGLEHQTIVGLLAFANASEHSLFTAAERRAYSKNNPRLGKVADIWAKTGIVNRALLGGGAGMAVTTVATGLAAVSGVGLVAAGAIGLSVKAAKSIGMYKLNKGAQTVKQFDKKAHYDETLVSVNHNPKRNMSDVLRSTSDNLIDTINSRVEIDQKENRRKLAIAVGAVAVGAIAGSVLHSYTNGGGNNHIASKPTPTLKPSVTETSQPRTPQTSVASRPSAPANNPPAPNNPPVRPEHPGTTRPTPTRPSPTSGQPTAPQTPVETPAEAPVLPPTPQTPVVPAEVPVESPVVAPALPPELNVDITRPTWSVAHDFAPGNEFKFMQSGIDKFNSIHNTNFAFTPHNGTTWIMDNAHAISPAQMHELNLLMLEDSLQTA